MSSSLKRKTLGEKPTPSQDHEKRQKLSEEERVMRAIEKEDDDDDDEDQESRDEDESSATEDSDADSDEESVNESDDASDSAQRQPTPAKKLKKRNDPSVFATSISKILASKAPKEISSEPITSKLNASSEAVILSRSTTAIAAVKALATSRLEQAAHRKLRDEKRTRLDKGRIIDVLGLQTPDVSTAEIIDRERKYKKIAQRGAVMLFNAIRTSQKEAERAMKESQEAKGGDLTMVGREGVDEKVTEMSKKGFLELIAGGGKKDYGH
jgi:mitochondrial fusion and transport protein UGO1